MFGIVGVAMYNDVFQTKKQDPIANEIGIAVMLCAISYRTLCVLT